jgi:hypothetical protein
MTTYAEQKAKAKATRDAKLRAEEEALRVRLDNAVKGCVEKPAYGIALDARLEYLYQLAISRMNGGKAEGMGDVIRIVEMQMKCDGKIRIAPEIKTGEVHTHNNINNNIQGKEDEDNEDDDTWRESGPFIGGIPL